MIRGRLLPPFGSRRRETPINSNRRSCEMSKARKGHGRRMGKMDSSFDTGPGKRRHLSASNILPLSIWSKLLEAFAERRKRRSCDKDGQSSVQERPPTFADCVREPRGRGDVQNEVVLRVCDHLHPEICRTPRLTQSERHLMYGMGCVWPVLTPECFAWCNENIPGYGVRNNPSANFIIDIVFKSERDATLFKMFWL